MAGCGDRYCTAAVTGVLAVVWDSVMLKLILLLMLAIWWYVRAMPLLVLAASSVVA